MQCSKCFPRFSYSAVIVGTTTLPFAFSKFLQKGEGGSDFSNKKRGRHSSITSTYRKRIKYLQSDWSRREQHWLYCTLNLNIVLLDKKQQHSNSVSGKNRNLLIKNKLIIN